MTDEQKRKFNREWKDATRTQRSTERRNQLRKILAEYGWGSESELHTAIINGDVVPPTKNKIVRSDADSSK